MQEPTLYKRMTMALYTVDRLTEEQRHQFLPLVQLIEQRYLNDHGSSANLPDSFVFEYLNKANNPDNRHPHFPAFMAWVLSLFFDYREKITYENELNDYIMS